MSDESYTQSIAIERKVDFFFGGVTMSDKNIKWIKAAAVRAVKTMAQTAVATIGTAALMTEVDWVMIGSASVLAGVLSLLTSVAGLPEVKE